MSKPYRCEACNAVEHGHPFTLCVHCHDEFRQLRQLATKIRQKFDLWHVPSAYEAIRLGLNRLLNK